MKAPVYTQISLEESPEALQVAINKRLSKDEYKVLSIEKVVAYPYKDKEREVIDYKAYLRYGNLMLLLVKYDILEEVQENSMIAGDIIRMADYWNNYVNGSEQS